MDANSLDQIVFDEWALLAGKLERQRGAGKNAHGDILSIYPDLPWDLALLYEEGHPWRQLETQHYPQALASLCQYATEHRAGIYLPAVVAGAWASLLTEPTGTQLVNSRLYGQCASVLDLAARHSNNVRLDYFLRTQIEHTNTTARSLFLARLAGQTWESIPHWFEHHHLSEHAYMKMLNETATTMATQFRYIETSKGNPDEILERIRAALPDIKHCLTGLSYHVSPQKHDAQQLRLMMGWLAWQGEMPHLPKSFTQVLLQHGAATNLARLGGKRLRRLALNEHYPSNPAEIVPAPKRQMIPGPLT